MATWFIVMLFSVGAVLLFVVGLSLTLMIKGHHIDSEIATNRHMRERGITCAAADARHDRNSGSSVSDCADGICTGDNCASCTSNDDRS